MPDNKDSKYRQALEVFGSRAKSANFRLMVALCRIKLEDYRQALQDYQAVLVGMLRNRRSWFGMSMPYLLVNAYAMAYLPDLYPQVDAEIEAYKKVPEGDAPMAHTAYAEMHLLRGESEEALAHVPAILKRPKYKDVYAVGLVVQAIANRRQEDFDAALAQLLQAHRGQAKFGQLRESPEGYLCLHAMTLVRVAQEYGLTVTSDSEYLSLPYLAYAASGGRV